MEAAFKSNFYFKKKFNLIPLQTEKDEYFKQEALLKHNIQTNVIYFRRSNSELKKAGLLKKTQKSCFKKNSKKKFYKKSSLNSEGIPDPRGRKKKANDTLPKHPMSAYLHFAKEMRPIIKESFPDATLIDVSKQIGSKWRSMTQSELCPWIELANQDKARYANELKHRISSNEELDNETIATVAHMVYPHSTSLG